MIFRKILFFWYWQVHIMMEQSIFETTRNILRRLNRDYRGMNYNIPAVDLSENTVNIGYRSQIRNVYELLVN